MAREERPKNNNNNNNLFLLYTHVGSGGVFFGDCEVFTCAAMLCGRKSLGPLSFCLSPTHSVVRPACLLSNVVFHHVHSPSCHATTPPATPPTNPHPSLTPGWGNKTKGKDKTRCLLPSSGRMLQICEEEEGESTVS